jgi:hypothetical protein
MMLVDICKSSSFAGSPWRLMNSQRYSLQLGSSSARDLRRELAGLIADCDPNTQDTKCPVIQRLAL